MPIDGLVMEQSRCQPICRPEPTMPRMLLIIEPAGQRRERGREAGQAVYERMLQFSADLQARGL